MNTLIDISLELTFFVISIMLWLYGMLISSDIPVNISKNEFIGMIISFILFGVFYSIYIRKGKRKEIIILLLIPSVLWLVNMVYIIRYNYQAYNTILSIMGFIITGYCAGLSIYKFRTIN